MPFSAPGETKHLAADVKKVNANGRKNYPSSLPFVPRAGRKAQACRSSRKTHLRRVKTISDSEDGDA